MERKEYFEKAEEVCYCELLTKEYGNLEIHFFPPKKRRERNPWILVVNGYLMIEFEKNDVILVREFIKTLGENPEKKLSKDEILSHVRISVEHARRVLTNEIPDEMEARLAEIVDAVIKMTFGVRTKTRLHAVSELYFSEAMDSPFTVGFAMDKDSDFSKYSQYAARLKNERIPRIVFRTKNFLTDPAFYLLLQDARWFSVALETEAGLLTPEVSRELSESGINSVIIPLSSLDEETEFHISGGHPKEILQGIKTAVKYGLDVMVKSTVTEENTDYLSLVEELHKLGVRHFSVKFEGNVRDKDIIFKRAYFYIKINDLEISLESFGAVQGSQLKRMKANRPIIRDCLTDLWIKNDGNVYPSADSLESLGNLMNETLSDIWSDKKTKEIRKDSLRRSKYEKWFVKR